MIAVIAHSRASPAAYVSLLLEKEIPHLSPQSYALTIWAFTTLNGLWSISMTEAFHSRASLWKLAPGNHSGMYLTDKM